jgi:tetratricopeptide (TPR) repeat protein
LEVPEVKLSLNKALNLAEYHKRRGDLDKSEQLYKAVLKAFPKNENARVALTKISKELMERQAQEHEQLLADELRSFYEQSKMEEARSAAKELIVLNPDLPIAWSILGGAELALENHGEAVTAFRKLQTLLPNDPNVANNLASALVANNKSNEAIQYYQQAIKLKKDFVEPHIGLANCLQSANRLDEAIITLDTALKFNPSDGRGLAILGTIKLKQGANDEAIAALQKATESSVFSSDAHRQLTQLVKYEKGNAHISQVEEILNFSTLTLYDQCQMHFAYAKMQEDLENYAQAFQYYRSAGQLRKKSLGYNFARDVAYFNRIKEHFATLGNVENPEWSDVPSPSPIFIVGMPRSGTSLLEQIISSHSQVTPAGELHYVGSAGKQLVQKNLNDIANLKITRDHYTKKLAEIGSGAAFVTDKMPHNFQYIGVIKKIFPNAKIIHTKRDPGAVCWSNFTRYFPAPELAYSFDIVDVVKYYQMYADLMDFWKNEFPNGIYEVDYDRLTTNPEPHIRALISHLGLDWEDACLAPHKNKRIVLTASREQVKERIYTGSSQAWKKFEPFLNGAFDELYT